MPAAPDNSSASNEDDSTNPELEKDAEKLPKRVKFSWALGSLGDNYAGNTISQLKDPVYTVALGLPPEVVGWALSLPRILDALLDPLIGFWSDSSQSKWGRRRPFLLAGGVLLAFSMVLMWMPPSGPNWTQWQITAYLVFASMLFYAAYGLFLVPYRALGLEQTSDYNERTRLQGWGMMVGLTGGLGLPWLYKLALIFGGGLGDGESASREVILEGSRWVGLAVAGLILVTCIFPVFGCRENPKVASPPRTRLFAAIAATVRNRPFVLMLGMNFFAHVGIFSAITASLLVSIYFLFAGQQDPAATLIGFVGMAQMLGAFIGLPINTRISVMIGKRGASLVALAIGSLGYLSLWFTLVPSHPYWAIGSQFLIGWGIQGVFLMSATMNADVCDSEELATGHRREGLYGAVFALEQKIALALALVIGGYLVTLCGYVPGEEVTAETQQLLRRVLVFCPVASLGVSAGLILFYPLSHRRVMEIQMKLRARRSN